LELRGSLGSHVDSLGSIVRKSLSRANSAGLPSWSVSTD
jgi:hypothetical protein